MDNKEIPSARPKRGRPRIYEPIGRERGAPRLAVRLKPEIFKQITERPEGPRAYIEALVEEDMAKAPPPPLSGSDHTNPIEESH